MLAVGWELTMQLGLLMHDGCVPRGIPGMNVPRGGAGPGLAQHWWALAVFKRRINILQSLMHRVTKTLCQLEVQNMGLRWADVMS